MGRQLCFSILWVANYQTLSTTGLDHALQQVQINKADSVNFKKILILLNKRLLSSSVLIVNKNTMYVDTTSNTQAIWYNLSIYAEGVTILSKY